MRLLRITNLGVMAKAGIKLAVVFSGINAGVNSKKFKHV